MTTIRKFLYASLLALSALGSPALISAQEMAHGEFVLPHEVHWQNALVPAGEYHFTFANNGVAGMFTLMKMNGGRAGFLFIVSDTDESVRSNINQIVLNATPQGSYVSEMELPEYGMTLHFTVPGKAARKELAKAATGTSMSAQ